MKTTTNRIEQIAGVAALLLLIVGCLLVLRPFVTAILWAGILCFSTWPIFLWIENRVLRGRRTLAALVMVLLTSLVLVAPFVAVGLSLAEHFDGIHGKVTSLIQEGLPPPPQWVEKLPAVGGPLSEYWQQWSTQGTAGESGRIGALAKSVLMQSRGWLLHRGMDLGNGIIQLTLSMFIAFFFYRGGESVLETISAGFKRIVGDQTQHYLEVVGQTVRSVVYGIIGTALAQSLVAVLGFWIAGAPSPLLLGLAVFFLSMVLPGGPPLIWVPVAVWLFFERSVGWGIFMTVYGAVGISGVDNVIRPYIISRGTDLPFVLVFFGVVGGLVAFGFIGFFLGPVLLAMGYCLLHEWIASKKAAAPAAAVPAPPPPDAAA